MLTWEFTQLRNTWKYLWKMHLAISTLTWAFYRQLPLNLVSRCWGWTSQIELPPYLRPTLIGFYVWLFRCRVEDAAITNLKDYRSLSDFFRRKLRPGIRPIDDSHILTCPCDGRILHLGEVMDGMLEQVKGVTYNLSSFFGPLGNDICRNFTEFFQSGYDNTDAPCQLPEVQYMHALKHQCENRLYFCTIYLGPGDYHRFHAPTDWTVHSRRYFPGNLFSVNPSVAKRLRGLFSLNERAMYFGRWRHGFFSFTAVGATNVGSINVYCDQELVTNRHMAAKTHSTFDGCDFTNNNNDDNDDDDDCTYGDGYDREVDGVGTVDNGVTVEKGQMVGDFNFGSTIVLVFEAPRNFTFSLKSGERVKYGEGLGSGHVDYCDHIM